MTVKELIERLSQYDGDLEVLTKKTDIFGNCGDVFSVKESTYGFFTDKDFAEMSEDSSAWESDYEVLDTVRTDLNTNREIVQEGLDARAAAREEATQEAQDDLFLDELNKLTQASRDMTARLEAAQRRARAQKREQRREQRQATRRDTFMQRLFVTVAIIAAVILLWNYGAVALWLAMTIGIAGLIYIIAISVGYWRKPRRKADNHA